MCTLAVWVTGSVDLPFVVAANRDERLDRPAAPPLVWPGPPRFVSPRDLEAGGSWLGLNEHGLFVGLTNRAGSPRDPTRRSRGLLVTDALRAPSAAELDRTIGALDPRTYAPFHLVYADRADARLAWIDGDVLRRERLERGLHVVTERSAHDEGPRAELIRRHWPTEDLDDPDTLIASLSALLGRHADDPFAATCIHADAFGYGTRSALVLLLGASWRTTRFVWAEGRPCSAPFHEQRALVDALRAPVE